MIKSMAQSPRKTRAYTELFSDRTIIFGFVIFAFSLLYVAGLWSFPVEDKKNTIPLPGSRPKVGRVNETQSAQVHNPPLVSNILDLNKEEWTRILKLLEWAEPDSQITTANLSTSPVNSTFAIENFQNSYYIGKELYASIIAKDFMGRPKRYGGDFFQAKLYSDKLKASVFGEVHDNLNGTYSVRFILPWVGQASVAIRLIHSSEAIQALKRHWREHSDRVLFYGFFKGTDLQGGQVQERMLCSIKWEGVVLPSTSVEARKTGTVEASSDCCCEYQDARTGLIWQCQRPKVLHCDTLVQHSMGVYNNPLTPLEKILMDGQHVNRWLKGDSRLIQVKTEKNATLGSQEPCRPGLPTPVPAGFYTNDVWTSLVCKAAHFTSANATTQCLKDKNIRIMGDSTSRQWFDFLIKAVPTLKRMDLHSPSQVGPLMAVDVDNNIALHYTSQGLPLRCLKAPFVSLHYMSNEIDGMAGGPHEVIILTMWAHFTTLPLSYYAHRVALLRRSIEALLKRAPDTKIIIKSANTGYKDVFGSDWISMQQDHVLREAFRGVGVFFLDVWQMTACHYSTDNIHPGPTVIQNEVDLVLSFICPP